MYYRDRETSLKAAAIYVSQQKTSARDRLKANAAYKKTHKVKKHD